MKNKLFLIKNSKGKEVMIRLPVSKYDIFTPTAFKMIRTRLGTGAFKYALNIESYSNAESLLQALKNYQNNKI